MELLLLFASVLLLGVLISGYAERSIISTSVLFLLAGFLFSIEPFRLLPVSMDDERVKLLAELALFGVLFTDGMRLGISDLTRAWHLPGRALLLGMPLTVLFTAVLARFFVDVTWTEAFLLGAVLAPTDPVFASAIVGKAAVPHKLRHLLNVESGLNDGLALPAVVILLTVVHHEPAHYGEILLEVVSGAALGVVIPYVALKLEHSRFFSASTAYQPLNAFAIGLLVLAVSKVVHGNEYLAAFAAGITMATVGPETRDAFHRFGELVTELLKLLALMIFGALITPTFLTEIPIGGYVFAVLVLLLVRPAALGLALIGSRMPWQQQLAAAWFGPKGFASVVYGMLVLQGGHANADELFHIIAIVVALSIIAHSSTDVVIAKYFEQQRETEDAARLKGAAEPGADEAAAPSGPQTDRH